MKNTTRRDIRHVLGSSARSVATYMHERYTDEPYEYIHDTLQWVTLSEEERLNIIFSDTGWAKPKYRQPLATLVVKFFKEYIATHPRQNVIDMNVLEKFVDIEEVLKQDKIKRKAAKAAVKQTPAMYSRSLDFILSILPTLTKDMHIKTADIDTPADSPPTITLTLFLPTREG